MRGIDFKVVWPDEEKEEEKEGRKRDSLTCPIFF